MKLHTTIPSSILLVLALLVSPFVQAAEESKVLATINGIKLTQQDFRSFIKMRMRNQKQSSKLTQQQIESLFNEFINRELLYQDALKKKFDKSAEVVAEVENQRRNIISSFHVNQLNSKIPSDKEIEKVYKEQLARPGKQYHAKHILVKTEKEAKAILAEISKGNSFEKLAKEKSIDSSGQKGGDLGWFNLGRMVRPFAAAVAQLQPGTTTPAPVQTRFGWHIIRLVETRDTPPPSLAQVKPRIIRMLQRQRISEYVAGLRKQAKIKLEQ